DNTSHRQWPLTSSIYNYTKNCFTTTSIKYTPRCIPKRNGRFHTEYIEEEGAPRDSFTLELFKNSEKDNLSLAIYGSSSCNASVKLYIITASNEKKCLYGQFFCGAARIF